MLLRAIDLMVHRVGGPNPFVTQDLRAVLARIAPKLDLNGRGKRSLRAKFIQRFEKQAAAWGSDVVRPSDETGAKKFDELVSIFNRKRGYVEGLGGLTPDALSNSLARLVRQGHLIRIRKGKFLRAPSLGLLQLLTRHPDPLPAEKVSRWPLAFQETTARFPPFGKPQRIPHALPGRDALQTSPEGANLPTPEDLSGDERNLLKLAADFIQAGTILASFVQGAHRKDAPFAVLSGGVGNGYAARKHEEDPDAYARWVRALIDNLGSAMGGVDTDLLTLPMMGVEPPWRPSRARIDAAAPDGSKGEPAESS